MRASMLEVGFFHLHSYWKAVKLVIYVVAFVLVCFSVREVMWVFKFHDMHTYTYAYYADADKSTR